MITFKSFWNHLHRTDKNILKLSFALFVIFLSFTIIGTIAARPSPGEVFSGFMGALVFMFAITGLLAFYYHKEEGIISTDRILILMAKLSIALSIIIIIIWVLVPWMIYFDLIDAEMIENEFTGDPIIDFLGGVFMFCGLFIAFSSVVFIGFFCFFLLGFGMMGFLAAIQRGITPEILLRISKITKNTSDKMRETNSVVYWKYRLLRWVYNISEVLDTRKLRFKKDPMIVEFPWKEVRTAVLYQFLFSTLILIYISLNPFLLERGSPREEFQKLFGIASTLTYIIPLFILPWFIYLRLDSRIKGPHRDFRLYNGLKSRMIETLVAFGTIVFIVRMAVREIDIMTFISSFVNYYVFFFITAIVITFIYFNYYENKLASDIIKRYKVLRDFEKKK
ncbi:MAG: hypothetical protein JSV49_12385 [Thermoplasmata archaeon]|nr:MAG: hypothetical protein JSV49_12385 [Thermoplasmata archaeon]